MQRCTFSGRGMRVSKGLHADSAQPPYAAVHRCVQLHLPKVVKRDFHCVLQCKQDWWQQPFSADVHGHTMVQQAAVGSPASHLGLACGCCACRCVSREDAPLLMAKGLAVVDCSWNRLNDVPFRECCGY
eukprot:GHRR01028502.1.p1 GENE.GHRR01028502.1~~GHRR01028502.1.p1  ORF type:complete len:129 (+),score=26.95 GHRR01028502.1:133-519(+)